VPRISGHQTSLHQGFRQARTAGAHDLAKIKRWLREGAFELSFPVTDKTQGFAPGRQARRLKSVRRKDGRKGTVSPHAP
jgi:hypothetical protein